MRKLILSLVLVLSTMSFAVDRRVFIIEHRLSIDYNQVGLIESGGKEKIISKENAIGIMQITLPTLKEYNTINHTRYTTRDLFDSIINKKIGIWLLDIRIPKYFIIAKIPNKLNYRLIAYNFGIGNTIKWYRKGHIYNNLPEETKNYLIKYWDKY